jgi:DNA-binding NarL/FixJ family response regulator
MPIRVYHCDDSQAFTRLVWHWLTRHQDIDHVGAAHSADDALAAVAGAHPDVILLDTMGSPEDPRLLTALRKRAPGARIVVYSGYVGLMDLDGGADAYVAKSDDESDLLAAIRAS